MRRDNSYLCDVVGRCCCVPARDCIVKEGRCQPPLWYIHEVLSGTHLGSVSSRWDLEFSFVIRESLKAEKTVDAKDSSLLSHSELKSAEDKTPPLVCTTNSSICVDGGCSKDSELKIHPYLPSSKLRWN